MQRATILAGAVSLALAACATDRPDLREIADWPDPPAVTDETLVADYADYRERRRNSLVNPNGGALLWIGLSDIPEGETPFGSREDLAIRLPAEDAAPVVGRLRREGLVVTLIPDPDAGIQHVTRGADSGMVSTTVTEPMVLNDDRSGETTVLSLGSLRMRVHAERGSDRRWLRVWDTDMPERETFQLPEHYPVEQRWRVMARFEPYDEPRTLYFPDVTGGEIEYRAPGELEFELNGERHSLIATANPTSERYFILMWDSTATTETYQGGRYLSAPVADEDGWTVIDFNYAYNAPCVFTDYSVCALPPRENWLGTWIEAGEKRLDK